MDETAVLEIARDATWMLLLIAAPLLIVGTVAGVVIALLQALTTLQETTLTFVPKIIAMLVAMVLFLPFMTTSLIEFTQRLFDRIVVGG